MGGNAKEALELLRKHCIAKQKNTPCPKGRHEVVAFFWKETPLDKDGKPVKDGHIHDSYHVVKSDGKGKYSAYLGAESALSGVGITNPREHTIGYYHDYMNQVHKQAGSPGFRAFDLEELALCCECVEGVKMRLHRERLEEQERYMKELGKSLGIED
jgi:hypothetical protein